MINPPQLTHFRFVTKPIHIWNHYFPYWNDLIFFNFQIKDIQENDQGKYQCQVLLTVTEKISADVSVSVRIPPIIFDNSTRSVIVSEGEGVKLECYAGGYPAPIVTYYLIIHRLYFWT